jgi:hypothetical protein
MLEAKLNGFLQQVSDKSDAEAQPALKSKSKMRSVS